MNLNEVTAGDILKREYDFQYALKKIRNKYYIVDKSGKKVFNPGIKDLKELETLVEKFLNANMWFNKFNKKNKKKIITRYVKKLNEN